MPRELKHRRDDQTYLFRYLPGQESQVISWLIAWAANPAIALTWKDAAMLKRMVLEKQDG